MERTEPGPWQKELDDFVRAFSGAYLFGIPLLLTEEMWSIGMYIELWKLALFLLIALGINTLLAYFAGFKRESAFSASIAQAVSTVAVGAVAATVVLLVLGRITPADPLSGVLGKVVIQALPLSIGASIANAVIPREKSRQGDENAPQSPEPWRATLRDLGATAAGGIFVGFAIAPTAEVQLLAAEIDYTHQLALIVFSLAITLAIVFASGFSPQRTRSTAPGPFQRPLSETLLAYAVSLLVALAALYFFDRVTLERRPPSAVAQMLVLGLPTAIGGAAGRLLV